MSNCLTRGVLSIACVLLAGLCFAASPRADNERVHAKTYLIEREPAETIRLRLAELMPYDLRRFTIMDVDPRRNTLTVQGPLAAIEMADELIPRMQEIKQDIAYGTLSPIDIFTRPVAPELSLPRGRIYRCAVRDVNAFEAELNRRFGKNPTVSYVFTDYVENQSLTVAVLAPEGVQTEFENLLRQMGVLIPEPPRRTSAGRDFGRDLGIAQVQYQPGDFDIVSRTYRPSKTSIGRIDTTLFAAFEARKRYARLSPPVDGERQTAGTAVYEYVLQTPERTRSVRVEMNYDRREIFLHGDKKLCEQIFQLIEMIDQPRVPEGMERRVIAIGAKQANCVRQFASLYAMQSHTVPQAAPQVVPPAMPRTVPQTIHPVPRFDQTPPSRHDPPRLCLSINPIRFVG